MFYALKVLPVDNSIKTTANEKIHTLKHFRIQEKREDLTQSYEKKNLHLQNNPKKQRDNTKTSPKITITQR